MQWLDGNVRFSWSLENLLEGFLEPPPRPPHFFFIGLRKKKKIEGGIPD